MVSYCLMLTKFVWNDAKDFDLDSVKVVAHDCDHD